MFSDIDIHQISTLIGRFSVGKCRCSSVLQLLLYYISSNLMHARVVCAAYLADSIHTNIPAPRVAGRTVNHSPAVTVEEVFASRHAVQLTGVLSCWRDEFHFRIKVSTLNSFPNSRPIMWSRISKNMTTFALLLTSVIWEPLVAFAPEVSPIKLGALLLTEILGSLWTVLSGTMRGSNNY